MTEADTKNATDGPALRQMLADMEEPLRQLRGLIQATLLASQKAADGSAFTALALAMETEGDALDEAWRAAWEASNGA